MRHAVDRYVAVRNPLAAKALADGGRFVVILRQQVDGHPALGGADDLDEEGFGRQPALVLVRRPRHPQGTVRFELGREHEGLGRGVRFRGLSGAAPTRADPGEEQGRRGIQGAGVTAATPHRPDYTRGRTSS